jgi:rare lipoprotein A
MLKYVSFHGVRAMVCGLALAIVSCQNPKAVVAAKPANPSWKVVQTGTASWYGGYWHKKLTANGEHYNQWSMTAAHRTLPIHTQVRVTNLANRQSCIVRINNRGPYVKGRIIDLSLAAAKEIGTFSGGLGKVQLEVLSDSKAARMSPDALNAPLDRRIMAKLTRQTSAQRRK